VTHRWGFHTGGGGNHPNGSRSCPSHGYVLPLRTASTPSAESKPVPVLTAGYVIPARRCDALRNKRLAAVLRGSRAGERLRLRSDDRWRGAPHRGGSVSRQHWRLNHGGRPGREATRSLSVVARGAGGRPRDADPAAD